MKNSDLQLRLTLYAIIGLFGLGVWSFSKDFTQVYLDGETDKELCKLGPGKICPLEIFF